MAALSLFSFLFFSFFCCLGNISRTICWGGQGFKLIKFFPKREITGAEEGGNSSSSSIRSSILVIM
jgi:hypothetical protein